MNSADLIKELHKLNIQLRLEDGHLEISAPKGTITPELGERIESCKQELTLLLKEASMSLNASKKSITRATSATPVRLSKNQESIWYRNQLFPEMINFHSPSLFRLLGKLDYNVFEKSISEVIRRHEILRSTFSSSENGPSQIVQPAYQLKMPLVDCTLKNGNNFNYFDILSEEVKKTFDLEKGPLFRVLLMKLSDDEHLFFWMAHHIVWDDYSLDLMLNELSVLYGAYLKQLSSPLSELSIQYSDYSGWQNEWTKSESYKNDLAFWKQQLNSDIPVLQIPLDHPRPAQMSYRGGRVPIDLSFELIEELKNIANQQGTTINMVLLAAFAILLHRFSGQPQFALGYPIWARIRPQTESLIGSFVNTLILKINFDQEFSFKDFLNYIKNTYTTAFSHQDISLDRLVDELNTSRAHSPTSIYQALFTYQDTRTRPNEIDNLKLIQIPEPPTKFASNDLFLCFKESKNEFSGRLDYNSDIFNKLTIERMADCYKVLLTNISADPDQTIKKLGLINKSSRNTMLFDWNKTSLDYSKTSTINDIIEKQSILAPQRIAVEFDSNKLSYAELSLKSNQLATYLISQGAYPGKLIGLCISRSENIIVCILGILKTGAAYVPLDPSFPAERLSYMISDANIEILITEKNILQELPEFHGKIICIDKESDYISKLNSKYPLVHNISPELTAYVIYTSGSTGKPKGVQVPHRAVVNFLISMRHTPGITQYDTVLALTTLSFDIAVLELLLPISVGARCHIISRDTAWDGEKLKKALVESKATIMQATPATWRLLLASGWEGSNKLKVLCGGEAFPKDIASELLPKVASLWNMYGPTETTVWSTCYQITDLNKPLFIGRPIANTQIYILDKSLQPVPIGVPGDLWIGGDGVTKGYLNRPDLTKNSFVQNPFSSDSSIFYKTGDLAKYHPDGNIECLGRSDKQVKVRGFRIELGEIETMLGQCEAVAQCAVTTVEVNASDIRLVAFVVPKLTNSITLAKIKGFLRDKLPEYMIPQHIIKLNKFPLTPNGKIDRNKLASLFVPDEIKSIEQYIPPSTTTQITLVKIWQEILGNKQIGITDNFFDLGGHSLLAVQIASKILKTLNINIILSDIITNPTIETLAAKIELLLEKNTPQFKTIQNLSYIVPLKETGNKAPFFCVHGVGGNVLHYNSFVPYLNSEQPLYGIQCRGLDGITKPFKSINEMANTYIQELRQIQPHGPYKIGGGSMGGLVAFEMAQQLIKTGENIELLLMFDSYSPCYKVNKKSQNLCPKKSKHSFLAKMVHSIKCRLEDYSKFIICKSYRIFDLPIPHNLRYWFIEQKNISITNFYKPAPYHFPIIFFREINENPDPNRGWKNIALGGIKYFDLDCGHENMIEYLETAKLLNEVLVEHCRI